jgi:hypothetical protein
VCWPGDGEEMVAEEKLGGGSACALGEGEIESERRGESKRGCLPFIGAIRQWRGRRRPVS